jgi:hypothetical protein
MASAMKSRHGAPWFDPPYVRGMFVEI